MNRHYYLTDEAMDVLGARDRAAFLRLIHRGEIRAVKVGRAYRINRDDIDSLARGELPTWRQGATQ